MKDSSAAANGLHRVLLKSVELAPASVDQYITVAAMYVTRGNPHGVFTRRNFPTSVLPHVGVSVPPVIARNPNVPPTRSMFPTFMNGNGRSHTNDNFSLGRYQSQRKTKERDNE
jgi:hypothetical protein